MPKKKKDSDKKSVSKDSLAATSDKTNDTTPIIKTIDPLEGLLLRVTNAITKVSPDGKTIHVKTKDGQVFDIGVCCGLQRIEHHLKSRGVILA